MNVYYKKFDKIVSINDRNFRKILDFYLINCPVEGKSVRGEKLKDYGFTTQKGWNALINGFKSNASPSLKKNFYCKTGAELQEKFQEIEKVCPTDEYCVFNKKSDATIGESLLSAIRNSFAHGSFNKKTYDGVKIYFLLNFDRGKIKAQLVLHEDTLLSWIDFIKSGYTPTP